MKIYLVGGAVRDQLLGRPVRERDWVVVGATAQEMKSGGFRAKDPAFPVYVHPETGEEYALARRETKRGSGYKGFEIEYSPSVTLEEDLARRDLTINAIAQTERGCIIDPLSGQTDLQSRRLRHITSAFVEDPLRVLRLARLHAELEYLGFAIDRETQSLAVQICASGELRTLSAGRIWRESLRALTSPHPATYWRDLQTWGALPELMPWLQDTSVSTINESIEALARATIGCDDPDVRWAAWCARTSLGDGLLNDAPDSWPLPSGARVLARLCVEHPLPNAADPDAILNWLEAIDAWRRGDRFRDLLHVWRAVSPGMDGLLTSLSECREVSRQVPAPAPGSDPRASIRAWRLQRIIALLEQAR